MRIRTEAVFALETIIGIGIGVAIAVAICFCRGIQPIATAIPMPTDRVFSSLFDAAKCQPTHELIGNGIGADPRRTRPHGKAAEETGDAAQYLTS
jgi:hypothetical protein